MPCLFTRRKGNLKSLSLDGCRVYVNVFRAIIATNPNKYQSHPVCALDRLLGRVKSGGSSCFIKNKVKLIVQTPLGRRH